MTPTDTNPPRVQRAIVQARYGEPGDVLSLSTSHPVAVPSPTQVQVRVHAASLNPIDWQMIQGNRSLLVSRSFPFVPLFDLAGVVVAVGEAVARFEVGDAVHADNKKEGGGASEFANVEQDLVSLKPESVGFAEAAAIPLAAQTALLALERGGVGEGSRVCIIGASGGVGGFAVQIAKALGAAHVVGVCSVKNGEFVRSLGADATIDYTRIKPHEALPERSMHAVIDCVGGRGQWVEAQKMLMPGGRFATIARDEDGKVTVGSALSMIWTISGRKLGSFVGDRIGYVPVFLDASHGLLDRVDEMVKAGKVKVPIDARYEFGLEGVLEAIERGKRGRTVGKSVIEIVRDETSESTPPVAGRKSASRITSKDRAHGR